MKPRFIIEHEDEHCVTIRDIGPWTRHLTVTNGAEEVVAELASILRGRRLKYYDSDGEPGELLIKDGKFAGFGTGQ